MEAAWRKALTIWYASFRNESFFSSSDCRRGGFGLAFESPLFEPSAIKLRKSCVWSMDAIPCCCCFVVDLNLELATSVMSTCWRVMSRSREDGSRVERSPTGVTRRHLSSFQRVPDRALSRRGRSMALPCPGDRPRFGLQLACCALSSCARVRVHLKDITSITQRPTLFIASVPVHFGGSRHCIFCRADQH